MITTQHRDDETKLWQAYKAGDQRALGSLMQKFNGTVNRWAMQNASPNIPHGTLTLEAWKHVKKQIDTFNPSNPKKANLNTWINWGLQKGKRFVQQQANTRRIPEPRASLVGIFNRAKEDFEDEHGRPPSLDELYDRIGADSTLDPGRRKRFTRKVLAKLEKEVLGDVPITGDIEDLIEDGDVLPDEAIARDLLYRSLGPRDQVIFEHAFGYGGKPQKKNVEIAKLVKTSPTTVGKRVKHFREQFQKLTV